MARTSSKISLGIHPICCFPFLGNIWKIPSPSILCPDLSRTINHSIKAGNLHLFDKSKGCIFEECGNFEVPLSFTCKPFRALINLIIFLVKNRITTRLSSVLRRSISQYSSSIRAWVRKNIMCSQPRLLCAISWLKAWVLPLQKKMAATFAFDRKTFSNPKLTYLVHQLFRYNFY